MVSALIALCKREGGERFVADKAVVSAENLLQITKGVKLPSGRARGVGPALRSKLNAAYPDWLLAPTTPVKQEPGYSTIGLILAQLYDALPDDVGLRADAWSAAAAELRKARHQQFDLQSGTPVPPQTVKKTHA